MKTLLNEATRDELIEELKQRESISYIYNVGPDEGTTIDHKRTRLSITEGSYIFVITPNKKNCD